MTENRDSKIICWSTFVGASMILCGLYIDVICPLAVLGTVWAIHVIWSFSVTVVWARLIRGGQCPEYTS